MHTEKGKTMQKYIEIVGAVALTAFMAVALLILGLAVFLGMRDLIDWIKDRRRAKKYDG